MNDLDLIGLTIGEKARLEAMGVKTLDQLVVSEKGSLGFSKDREALLYSVTANILSYRLVSDVLIKDNEIKVVTDKVVPEPVLAAMIMELLGYSNFQVEASGAVLQPRSNPFGLSFGTVVEKARKLLAVLTTRKGAGAKLDRLDVASLMTFAQERGLEGFMSNVFGDIKGNELMKTALSVALFSNPMEPLHVLVVGEPGSGKTMARDTLVASFEGLIPVGANTTRAGLVCNRATGEMGVLATADGKVVLIDEFDKIDDDDLQYCYELFSNGKCRVDSGRVHTTITSHFTTIAFANPKWEVFKGNPINELGIKATMLSRFSLIVPSEMVDATVFKEILVKKIMGGSELSNIPHLYNQWVEASRYYSPNVNVSEDALESYVVAVVEFYEKYRKTPLRRDHRLTDYLSRLPKTLARSEFVDMTDATLKKSLEIVEASLDVWKGA